jgi:hypothetical protein
LKHKQCRYITTVELGTLNIEPVADPDKLQDFFSYWSFLDNRVYYFIKFSSFLPRITTKDPSP